MRDKIRNLEALVSDACVRLRKSEAENKALRLEVKGLSRELEKMQSGAAQLRELRLWRDEVKSKLKRVCARLDKAAGRGS
ncbi:MAG: hypothetical protein WC421_07225 [Elusimicrobiales bacterium]